MKVAIYARVSTDGQTVDNQLSDLTKHCELKGWTNVTTFIDEGISGAKTSRPQFDKMIEACKAGQFDVVMVWRFDRASRSTKHLLNLLDDLKRWGVDFVSHREAIDTSTAAGKLMFTMVSAFAQFERDVISDRTKAGMERLKREGKKIGRDRQYDRGQVIELKNKGIKTPEIAKRLGISESHCRKLVREAA